MYISLLRAKLHQARVTAADLNYEGSISIDTDLLNATGLYINEKVLIVDIENGQRFETYIIPAPAGSGEIQLNGAAARLVSIGDRLIIMAFASVQMPPPRDWTPCVAILDEHNRITKVSGQPQ